MAMTPDDLVVFDRLQRQLDAAQLDLALYERYYSGRQFLEQLGIAVPPQLRRFVTIVNWPRIAVEALSERIEHRGWRIPGSGRQDDAGLAEGFASNKLAHELPAATTDLFRFGRSYFCLGTAGKDDRGSLPVITIESPYEVTVRRDPRRREVTHALRRYDVVNGQATKATFYSADRTVWLAWDVNRGMWVQVDEDDHKLGRCLVVPMVNRPVTGIPIEARPLGTSEIDDLIPIVDAAARGLTNAQVAQETHAVPARGVLGATKSDFLDGNGQPLPAWAAYFGTVWMLGNKDAKTFQFEASAMENFERMHDLYARQASAVSGAPPDYFGLPADDAASADAIRSRHDRLNRKCEMRITTSVRPALATVAQLYLRLRDGKDFPEAERIVPTFYDVATISEGQRSDAVVKKHAAGLLPTKAAWEELGYSPEEITWLEGLQDEESQKALTAGVQDIFRGALSNDATAIPATTGEQLPSQRQAGVDAARA